MGFLDKVKAGAEQAAAKAKEGVHELELKRQLSGLYDDLGKKTFELVEAGELSHASLEELVGKIRTVSAELASGEEEGKAEESEAPAASGPPAMPV